jgi:hypothetical protein
MFQTQRTIKWLAIPIIAAVLLLLIPFSQREVATQRLEQELNRAVELRKNIADSCGELLPNENSPLERWFVGKLKPTPSTGKSLNNSSCVLKANSTQASQFHLLAQWSLGFEIFMQNSAAPIITQTYSTKFPLPLCFLPLLIFILTLPFNFSTYASICFLLFHLLFLSGLNLIQLIKTLPKTTISIVTTDRLFPGLLLFSLWFALRPVSERKRARNPNGTVEALVNSFFTNLIGIWNPILYTLLGPMLFNYGTETKKIRLFFNTQLMIWTLSLYVLGLELSNVYSVFNTFLTPRYLSFSIIFYLFTAIIPQIPNPQPLIWETKHFWKYLIVVTIVEILGFLFPELRSIPTLTRLALVFLLVDFSQSHLEKWNSIFNRWKGPLMVLIISSSVAAFSSEVGAIDLVAAICDPKKHPTAILPFTILSGFLLGFLTGGLTSPFFILVSQMIQAYPNPLIRAALFDGVLTGLMFSPFSLFNLYPSVQYKISLQKILQTRTKQLALPMGMGLLIYFVGTVTTLGVLPPVCFVFCCLTIVTYKLKQSRWKISMFGASEHNGPH